MGEKKFERTSVPDLVVWRERKKKGSGLHFEKTVNGQDAYTTRSSLTLFSYRDERETGPWQGQHDGFSWMPKKVKNKRKKSSCVLSRTQQKLYILREAGEGAGEKDVLKSIAFTLKGLAGRSFSISNSMSSGDGKISYCRIHLGYSKRKRRKRRRRPSIRAEQSAWESLRAVYGTRKKNNP